MEKILLKNAEDVKDAINLFGIEWEKEIKEKIKKKKTDICNIF